MTREQYLIFKNLPDGAIIHQENIIQNRYQNKRPQLFTTSTNIETQIKYFNQTLSGMFTLETPAKTLGF